MPNYKYPAPFDLPNSGPVEVAGAPQPPIYCGPPLPIDIPRSKTKAKQKRSLYIDLFGTDLSVIAEASDAPWASSDQQTLAARILNGQKSLNNLSAQELELLDDLAIQFNNHGGGPNETVRQTDGERLCVPDQKTDWRQDVEEVRPESRPGLQLNSAPDITGAYGWIRGNAGKDRK